jgi:tripartite-type tricarboxylate transporter receptor subunit TctC
MLRRITNLLAGLSVLLATAVAWPQAYPSKPVKVVVGSAAGTTPDVVARFIVQKLGDTWGSPVIVENRPGAAGMVASEFMTKSPRDGYTLLFSDNSSWAINPHLFAKIPYHPLTDFAPVIQVGVLPMFLVVVPSVPAASLQELLDYARKNPGKLSYGSAGNGSIHHITTELLKSMAGVDFVHVPYKGAAQSGAALLAGEIQMAFSGYTGVAQGLGSGRLRMIAVSTGQRSPLMPNVPTVSEAGLPGFDMSTPIGFNAPAGTPRDVIAKLNAGIAAAVGTQEVTTRMASLGIATAATSPEQFGALIRAEYEKFARLVKLSGARVD